MSELVREAYHVMSPSGKVKQTPAGPVIEGVLICGQKSKWGHDYPTSLWTADVLQSYEGCPSYTNHDRPAEQGIRDVSDKLGWFSNIRRRADGQPEGDFNLNPKHKLCESVVWAAEHNPNFYSLSHRAYVDYAVRNGQKVVSAIKKPVSIDLVADAATTGGLFEHAPPPGVRPVPKLKLSEYLNKLAAKLSVEQLIKAKTLPTLVKEGYGDAEMPEGAPDPAAAETTADGGLDSAFMSVCLKEIEDCMKAKGDPAKLKKCLGRLKKILMTHGELSTEDVDNVEEPEEEETKVEEGAPGTKKKTKKPAPAAAATTADANELLGELASEQFSPTPTQLIALKAMTQKTDRVAFIKEQKGLNAATPPQSKTRDKGAPNANEGAPGQAKTGVQQAQDRMRELARANQGVPPPKN